MVIGEEVDIHNAEVVGDFRYRDNNYGYAEQVINMDNPAHMHRMADGTVYSNNIAYQRVDDNTWKQW